MEPKDWIASLALVVSAATFVLGVWFQWLGKHRELRANAYAMYLSGLAIRVDGPGPGHEELDQEGRKLVWQGKYLSTLYGSPEVVSALTAFEYDGWKNNTTDLRREATRAIFRAMRADIGSKALDERLVSKLILYVELEEEK